MADVAVATYTRCVICYIGGFHRRNWMDQALVARATGLFGYSPVPLSDLYRLVKPAGRKIVRMPKSVPRLCSVFADKVGRRMAIIAGRDRSVTCSYPTVILVIHYVAISTGHRVIAHIRVTFAVPKCVNADPDGQTKADTHNDQTCNVKIHRIYMN
jgi:hypothetical protein